MIQDIAPSRFHVAYDLRAPKADSVICVFSDARILANETPDGTLVLPRFCELPVPSEDCWFLFSIDQRDYFWYRRPLPLLPCEYSWLSIRHAFPLKPQREGFAVMTAYHLAVWYTANRYCGRCGRPLARDGEERALVCGECGNLIYPRINPAIIVGVTDGDRLLITKYAPAHAPTKLYALIAGFCEIGESAEDTVRREVLEEVGLQIKNIRYYGSQPWGIAGNISLGFFAELDGSDKITLQKDELSLAEWVHRKDVPQRGNTLALTAEMMEAFRLGRVETRAENNKPDR